MTAPGQLPCDEAAILHGPSADAAPCSAGARRWTLVAAILGSGLAFIDGTVANVALPSLQRDLHADAFQAQWVIEAYALMLAALLLVGGAFGDRYGRRRVFAIGVGAFTVASALCGLSASIGQLIAARALQGIGAALMVPGSLALISANFPKADRGRAIGTWSAFGGITAAIGPLIGGYLIDRHGWAWAFLVNVPIGALLLAVCVARVPESRGAGERGAVDLAGAALATLGLTGLVFTFIEAPSHGWRSPVVWGSAGLGLASLALFVRTQALGRAPMLPLHLFRSRDFSGANLLTLLLYAALGGGLFYLPLNLIQVQGLPATAAGAAMLPFIAVMAVMSRWAGQLVDRHGPRPPLIVGPAIAAVGFALFAWPGADSGYWLGFFPAICILGVGMSITVAPLTTTVMNAVGDEMAGVASGVNNAVSRTAAVLAIAVFGALMASVFDASLTASLTDLRLPAGVVDAVNAQRAKLAGIEPPAGLDGATSRALNAAIGSAFVSGFRVVMLACAGLALLSALSAWRLIGRGEAVPPPR